MKEWMIMLGVRVRMLRAAAGLSQEELAERAQVTRATINYLENGRFQTRLATLALVAEALEVTVAELVGAEPFSGGQTPTVEVEAVYRVVCGVCGPVAEVGDVQEAAVIRQAHAVPHPAGMSGRAAPAGDAK